MTRFRLRALPWARPNEMIQVATGAVVTLSVYFVAGGEDERVDVVQRAAVLEDDRGAVEARDPWFADDVCAGRWLVCRVQGLVCLRVINAVLRRVS